MFGYGRLLRMIVFGMTNKGVPWTEEEHRRFLLGLQNVGKGDWRGISRNFVKTRTPTQVASHAQKYFLRRHSQNRRRRRSSLFDITTDSVMQSRTVKEEEQAVPLPSGRSKPVLPVPPSSKMARLELNGKLLSLKLPAANEQSPTTSGRSPASFQPLNAENFSGGGDSMISVA
ncbi:Transcription factor MYBS3, partial [Mucuna pruriens]